MMTDIVKDSLYTEKLTRIKTRHLQLHKQAWQERRKQCNIYPPLSQEEVRYVAFHLYDYNYEKAFSKVRKRRDLSGITSVSEVSSDTGRSYLIFELEFKNWWNKDSRYRDYVYICNCDGVVKIRRNTSYDWKDVLWKQDGKLIFKAE